MPKSKSAILPSHGAVFEKNQKDELTIHERIIKEFDFSKREYEHRCFEGTTIHKLVEVVEEIVRETQTIKVLEEVQDRLYLHGTDDLGAWLAKEQKLAECKQRCYAGKRANLAPNTLEKRGANNSMFVRIALSLPPKNRERGFYILMTHGEFTSFKNNEYIIERKLLRYLDKDNIKYKVLEGKKWLDLQKG